ncbi:cell wall protein DAN4-like isoform X2 [Biomphalaria pfeifferi]|uniref:Cell wall protein DAN4-like isoform X2 n=1 Tax=Biomphalaria pfeifferi TaxID=112525 RepID=A0AAD8AU53_BIOPF|nr:cell wall protein DAN4-like isoform X2 [Biomphalaria pfeifferi]
MYFFLLSFLVTTYWAIGLSLQSSSGTPSNNPMMAFDTTVAQVTTTVPLSDFSSSETTSLVPSTSSSSSSETTSTVPLTSSSSSSETTSTVPLTSSSSSSETTSMVPSTSSSSSSETTSMVPSTSSSSSSETTSMVPSTSSSSSSDTTSTVPLTSSIRSHTTSVTQPSSTTGTSTSARRTEQSNTNASATTISTVSPSIQTSSSESPAGTTPGISKVTSTKKPSPEYTIKISETNLLIDSGDIFLELEGPKNTTIKNISLVIQNATVSYSERNATLRPLEVIFNDDGFYVTKLSSIHKQITDWTSVLIVLLNSTSKSELDSLVYSTDSKIPIDSRVNESYFQDSLITFNPKVLPGLNVSFSRCSSTGSSKAFVVTMPTRNKKNTCQLTFTQKLELKMTSPTACVKDTLPQDFKDILTKNLILAVNKKKSCGFSWNMINVLQEKSECHSDKSLEVTVSFSISSAFQNQLAQIVEGYKSFLTDKTLNMNDNRVWSLDKCFENCSPSIKPPTNNDDDKIRLTVAVVVSCIGVFLIVLIAVVVYMKNKRHRILQFRMTRLDDDEDDLIGDMDDFVGNQGPTFRTFR